MCLNRVFVNNLDDNLIVIFGSLCSVFFQIPVCITAEAGHSQWKVSILSFLNTFKDL